jgi:sugar-specific transcriptional regulator TrmB
MAKLDKRTALRLLGFSPIQANLYLTLVKLGKTDKKTLAQHTSLPLKDVNKMLNDFQKSGLIEQTPNDPSKFRANPIEHLLPTLIAHKIKQEKQEQLNSNVINLSPESAQNLFCHPQLSGLGSNMTLLPTTETVLQKRSELVKTAQETIDVISTWQNYRFLLKSNFNRNTKYAVDRNVRFRFLVETPKNVKLPPEHLEAFELLMGMIPSLDICRLGLQ